MSWLGLEGHDEMVDRFRHGIASHRLGSAYLFVGLAGIGKFSFAHRLAQSLLCQRSGTEPLNPCGICPSCQQVLAFAHPDLLVISRPADRNVIPIDAMIGPRERRMQEGLCPWIALKPAASSRRIGIIDDADLLAVEGANSLLKTLEEPPPRSVLMLVAHNLTAQLPTIRSRCQVIHFRSLSVERMRQLIPRLGICDDPIQVEWLARMSGGSLARARQLSDPTVAAFRETWYATISQEDPDPVKLSSAATEFMDAAGKEAPLRRERLRWVVELTCEFYRKAMRSQLGMDADADAPFRDSLSRFRAWWPHDPEALGMCLNRCVSAARHIESYAQPGLVLDAWLDDVARVRSEGAYAEVAMSD